MAAMEKNNKNLNVPNLRFPEFSGEWDITTIGEISNIKNGPFGSVLHAEDYVSDGIPIVTTEHFKSGSLPIVKDGIPQVSEQDYIRLKGYKLQTNDIVFSRVGSVDINAYVSDTQNGWLFSGRVLRVRPISSVNSLCLHFVLSTEKVKQGIRSRAVGQTMPSINTPILSTTNIFLPKSLEEQRKISIFLALIDARLETQKKIIEDLKKLKDAINNSLHNNINEFQLFSFNELGNDYSGLTGKSSDDFGSGLPYISYLNVFRNDIVTDGPFDCVKVSKIEKQNVVSYGDLLFTLSSETPSEVGIGAIYLGKTNPIYLNSFCFGVHLSNHENIYGPYLAYFVTSQYFRRTILPFAQGSTRYNLMKSDFMKHKFCFPNIASQKAIYNTLHTLSEKVQNEEVCLNKYTEQKQYLLTRLFI